MTTSDRIVLVSGSDEGYAMHMAVMLVSAFANAPGQDFDVYLFDGGISEASKRKIDDAAARHGTEDTRIYWTNPDPSLWAGIATTSGHISAATYLRLFIPAYLPADVQKAIYIDADAIVERDLSELWEVDVEGWAAGAVQEQVLPYASSKGGIPKYSEYGLDSDTKSFNAGVLLINLAWWRDKDVPKQVLDYLSSFDGPVRLVDQDGLNIVLARQWKELPWRWNVCALKAPKYEQWSDANLKTKFASEVEVVRRQPGVVHFVSGRKPWMFGERKRYPWADRYYHYLHKSGWFDTVWEWRRWRMKEAGTHFARTWRDTRKSIRREARRLVPNQEWRRRIRNAMSFNTAAD